MRDHRVTLRGVAVPLALCAATAAGRMPWAATGGRSTSAFVHQSQVPVVALRGNVYGRRHYAVLAASRLRNTSETSTTAARRATYVQARHRTVAEAVELSEEERAQARQELEATVLAAVAEMPQRPRCAVIGGGFAGLATAYHLAAFNSEVTVFDPSEVGTAGASSVAAGLLHPLTPRGKRIWKGEEGLSDAKELIEVANAALATESNTDATMGCIMTDRIYRPLIDEKNDETFSKAAEDLPQWVTRLTAEEYLAAVPGADSNCLGGVRIHGALAVDAQYYLRGLWGACCNISEGSARWVRERVDDIHALAASGEYHAVVACVGAGVKILPGVKDIVSLRLVRGQSLIYDNVIDPTPRSSSSIEGDADGEAGVGKEAENQREKLLTSAVLCGQYVVPTGVSATGNGGKLVCGATQEPILYADALDKPADMAKAKRYLKPKVAGFFPALQGVEPLEVTSGVRVIQDRNSYGRIPIAGRLPFSERGWVLAALGARGLIHHAYLGRLLAACALLDTDKHLPPQVVGPLEDLGKDSTGDL